MAFVGTNHLHSHRAFLARHISWSSAGLSSLKLKVPWLCSPRPSSALPWLRAERETHTKAVKSCSWWGMQDAQTPCLSTSPCALRSLKNVPPLDFITGCRCVLYFISWLFAFSPQNLHCVPIENLFFLRVGALESNSLAAIASRQPHFWGVSVAEVRKVSIWAQVALGPWAPLGPIHQSVGTDCTPANSTRGARHTYAADVGDYVSSFPILIPNCASSCPLVYPSSCLLRFSHALDDLCCVFRAVQSNVPNKDSELNAVCVTATEGTSKVLLVKVCNEWLIDVTIPKEAEFSPHSSHVRSDTHDVDQRRRIKTHTSEPCTPDKSISPHGTRFSSSSECLKRKWPFFVLLDRH